MGLIGQATGLGRGRGGRRWLPRCGLAPLVLWASLCGVACDPTPIEAGDAGDAAAQADGGAEVEAIADAPADGEADSEAAGDAAATPGFSPGINPAGVHDPASFSELHDGDDLVIELGGQGLWMVVVAFRTHGVLTAPVTIEATLASGDTVLSALGLAGQALAREADGFDYYYDLFVVVDPAQLSGEDGQVAALTLRVSDGSGQAEAATVAVRLRGGPGAASRAP